MRRAMGVLRTLLILAMAIASVSCRSTSACCNVAGLIAAGDVDGVRSNVAAITSRDAACNGRSLWQVAAASRNGYESALVLRDAGIRPVPMADGTSTPLHETATWGDRKFAELLLANGADPAIRDAEGRLAIDVAKDRSDQDGKEIAQLLESYARRK